MRSLNIFPVSYKVQGKSIVIVGGGVEALNKARLAVKTSAVVRVFAYQFLADFSSLDVELVHRLTERSDFADAALVFVQGDAEGAGQAIEHAKALNIPLNVIDRPDLCDFYTPAIVDRAPISVAIASDGQSPVLSRVIRAKIEALLSPEVGALAQIGGELRARVSSLLSKTGARRFYEELAGGLQVEHALAGGLPAGRRAALRLLDAHASAPASEGIVWLIAAGPGSEDLLTLRAHRLLQEADVIVHDAQVPEVIVQMGRRDAQVISVGSALGAEQENELKINKLLIDLADKNLKVARLHFGDATDLGAIGRESEALAAAGLEHVIVPGVAGRMAESIAERNGVDLSETTGSPVPAQIQKSKKTA